MSAHTEKPKRRRRDGISYRKWDGCWYTSVTGKRQPLLDDQGEKIRGRHRQADAKAAYAMLYLNLSKPTPQTGPCPVSAICLASIEIGSTGFAVRSTMPYDR